jgi:hypothetical protein
LGWWKRQISATIWEVRDFTPLSLVLSHILNVIAPDNGDSLPNIVGVGPPPCVRIRYQMLRDIGLYVNSFWLNFYVSSELVLHTLCEMAFSE